MFLLIIICLFCYLLGILTVVLINHFKQRKKIVSDLKSADSEANQNPVKFSLNDFSNLTKEQQEAVLSCFNKK